MEAAMSLRVRGSSRGDDQDVSSRYAGKQTIARGWLVSFPHKRAVCTDACTSAQHKQSF